MTKLRECPFCGGDAVTTEFGEGGHWEVGCTDKTCACVVALGRDAAESKWNRRADDRYTVTQAGRDGDKQ